jgi:GxxExxY protein
MEREEFYRLSGIILDSCVTVHKTILELKSSEIQHPAYEAQIISYLKLSKKKLGFLINFNVPLIKDGFKRYVNNF